MAMKVVFVLALVGVMAVQGRYYSTKDKEERGIDHGGEKFVAVRALENQKSELKTFPDQMPLQLTTSEGKHSLFLKRNKHLNFNKMKLTGIDETTVKNFKNKVKDVAFYQEKSSDAVLTVRNSNNRRLFEGTLVSGNKRYELRPVDKSNNLRKTKSFHDLDKSVDLLDLHTLKEVDLNINYETKGKGDNKDLHASLRSNESPQPHINLGSVNDQEVVPDNTQNTDPDKNLRVRRSISASQTDFHIEMMFLFDYTTYSYWLDQNNGDTNAAYEEMLVYFAGIFNGIHMVYSSIETYYNGITITPWLKEVRVCTTAQESWFTEQSVTAETSWASAPEEFNLNTNTLFPKVTQWRYDNGYNWHNPDHLMVWTRYDIKGDGTIGVAPLGSLCKGSSSNGGQSINEDIGFHSWAVAAHEMGHNLGADHDGDRNSCSANDKYIMAPSVGALTGATVDNQHTFSSCSVNSFLNTLQGRVDGYPRVCAFDTVCDHGEPLADDANLPGQIYSLDQQCQFAFDENHSYTTTSFCESGNICRQLKCREGSYCRWGAARAAEGTPCGSSTANKWCRSGSCVRKTTSTESTQSCSVSNHDVPSDCEDTDGHVFNVEVNGVPMSLSCSEIIVEFPNFCFDFDSVASNCGYSCFSAGLAYDDSICENRNSATGSCSDTPGVTFSSSDGSGGITCSVAASYGWCVHSVVTTYCCGSCSAKK